MPSGRIKEGILLPCKYSLILLFRSCVAGVVSDKNINLLVPNLLERGNKVIAERVRKSIRIKKLVADRVHTCAAEHSSGIGILAIGDIKEEGYNAGSMTGGEHTAD